MYSNMGMDGEEIRGVFFFPEMHRTFHLFFCNEKPTYRLWNQCISATISKYFIQIYSFYIQTGVGAIPDHLYYLDIFLVSSL